MEIAAKLALFTTALVLALVAGWGAGQIVGPMPSLTTAPTHLHPASPHHLEHP